jgi:hypothetical protein
MAPRMTLRELTAAPVGTVAVVYGFVTQVLAALSAVPASRFGGGGGLGRQRDGAAFEFSLPVALDDGETVACVDLGGGAVIPGSAVGWLERSIGISATHFAAVPRAADGVSFPPDITSRLEAVGDQLSELGSQYFTLRRRPEGAVTTMGGCLPAVPALELVKMERFDDVTTHRLLRSLETGR